MNALNTLVSLGRPIAYYPSIRKALKNTVATIFLCQMAYWTGKQEDPDGWIFKTGKEWEKETGLSQQEQRTARSVLLKTGVLEEQEKKVRGSVNIKLYRLNCEAFQKLWEEELSKPDSKPDCKYQQRQTRHVVESTTSGDLEELTSQISTTPPVKYQQRHQSNINNLSIYTKNTSSEITSSEITPASDPIAKQPHPIAPTPAIELEPERSPEPESEPKGSNLPESEPEPEPTGTERSEVQESQPPTGISKNQAHCQAGFRSDETRLPPAAFSPEKEIQLPSSDLPPWRVKRGPNGWNQEIVQGVLDWMNHTFGGGKTRADAIAYIAKREHPSSPEYEVLLARVQEIENNRLPAHSGVSETLEESLERRGIKIATEPPPQPEFKGIPEEAMATWKMAREKLEQVKRDKERMERERRLGWKTTT